MKGADLSGTSFRHSVLTSAQMQQAKLYEADLSQASLQHANLFRASLFRAEMVGAVLAGADLRDAELAGANLTEVYAVGANLTNASLRGTNLTRANLWNAKLSGTVLSPTTVLHETKISLDSFGGRIRAEENARKYGDFSSARDIYRILRANFRSIGEYNAASWAYVKERQMEKETFHPCRARRHHGSELPEDCSTRSLRWWVFHFKYTGKWLSAWANELLCGYGERPRRTAVLAFMLLLIFPFLYQASAGIVKTTGDPVRWTDYFHYSLAAFSTIGFSDLIAENDLAKLLTSVEALLGISLLALLMFVLGNRISRS